MSELILKGTDLFMKKTGSADKLHICGNAERMLFLIIGILLVFAGAKVYRLIVSFIMFWGVTIALCTVRMEKPDGDDCNSIYDTWMSDGIYGI